MLIGLAVDDIKAVQDNAILSRQELTIQLTLESWYKIPNKWRYKKVENGRDRDNIVTLGEPKFSLKRFMFWIDPDTRITNDMLNELKHKEHDKIDDMSSAIEDLQKNVANVQQCVDEKISRIETLLEKLLQKKDADQTTDLGRVSVLR